MLSFKKGYRVSCVVIGLLDKVCGRFDKFIMARILTRRTTTYCFTDQLLTMTTDFGNFRELVISLTTVWTKDTLTYTKSFQHGKIKSVAIIDATPALCGCPPFVSARYVFTCVIWGLFSYLPYCWRARSRAQVRFDLRLDLITQSYKFYVSTSKTTSTRINQ